MEIVEQLLDEKFAAKKALRESNLTALKLGYEYAKEHFDPLPFRLEKMDENGDKILIDGNTATALGCVYAGATVAAWYPITPSTSVMDAFTRFLRTVPQGPGDGQNNCLIIQAEDELAAIGMVIGAQLERRARVYFDLRSRDFADERVAGPRLLRGDSRRHHGHPARGTVHRHADAHPAGRYLRVRLRLARRYQTYSAVPVESGRMLRIRGQELRPGGALSNSGLHAVAIWISA